MNNLSLKVILTFAVFAVLMSVAVSAVTLSDILSEISLDDIYPNGLKTYYPFENDGKDVAGNFNGNITSGSSAVYVSGLKAKTLDFGRQNNATLRDTRDYDSFFKQSHTVSAWINSEGLDNVEFNSSQAITQIR